ncbi:ryanodine receptor 1-like [Coturnix japonica]|uniref:ryanodine receptor 1-like n=1 Tax=Coturnix japonica TaxID=93934 RepID=UPI0007779AB2|nr:ryanodine receptor 1-like [Coturnix japonica]
MFLAFAINFILLFYKVSEQPPGLEDAELEGSGMAAVLDGVGGFDGSGGGSDVRMRRSPSVVYYCLEESTGYMQPALRALAVAHTIVAFLCIIGYNCLKIPLVIL